jgi:replicative DNA helicase
MESALSIKVRSILDNNRDEADLSFQLKRLVYEHELQFGSIRDSKSINMLYAENLSLAMGPAENNNVIKTDFRDLDEKIGGFSPGELIVIGGRPGMGKTQMLVNLALNISMRVPVQYFTFDLSSTLLANRFMATLSGIPARKLLQLDLMEGEKFKLASLQNDMSSRKLFVNDSCSNSISALKLHCLEQIKEHGIKVIIVDYIQMMSSNRYRNNRELEVSYISRELKNFAKDNNVCVITTSQLSRGVETRSMGSKKPHLSDLRESGSIEQDADKVIFIYRPEYYSISEDEDGNSTDLMTILIIAKNRNGAVDEVRIRRNKEFTSFMDFEGFKNDFDFSSSRLIEIEKPPF